MGKSYWFECSRCGYRARVSGRADRGLLCHVQTIVCRDCKQLYDAVTRLKVTEEVTTGMAGLGLKGWGLDRGRRVNGRSLKRPPTFQAAVNRLTMTGGKKLKWLQFKLECPVSPGHRVEAWNEPDKCPKCGIHLEKNVLPYRIWE